MQLTIDRRYHLLFLCCVCCGYAGRVVILSAPGFPAPRVHFAPHDISPSLENELVHELKARVQASKFIDVHPAHRGLVLSRPLDQQLLMPVSHPTFHCNFRLDTRTTIIDWQKLPRLLRRIAIELLMHTNVEHIMQLCSFLQLELVGDLTYPHHDLEWPKVL
jgi:hypothetical protein